MPKQLNLDLQIGFCWKIRGHCHYVCQKLVYTCWGGVSRRHTCNLWIGEQKPKYNPAAANVNMYAKSMATINCQQILYFGWFSGCYLPPDTSHCQRLSYAPRIGHQQILRVFAFSGRRCWHLLRTYPVSAPTGGLAAAPVQLFHIYEPRQHCRLNIWSHFVDFDKYWDEQAFLWNIAGTELTCRWNLVTMNLD